MGPFGSTTDANGLTAGPDKAATVFPSHVRRSFSRRPTDFTGDLVRLLDDISTVTHNLAAYVSEGSEAIEYGRTSSASNLDPAVATRQLYKALAHDGYACIILDRHHPAPLSLPEDAPHGGYVVVVNALDIAPDESDQPVCGTIFSVYLRRTQPSTSGTLRDLQQQLGDQVAAGFVMYASATTLFYSLGQGSFSFCLHPVARQYFLQPRNEITLREGCADVYADTRSLAREPSTRAAVRTAVAEGEMRGKIFDTGCLVANFHGAVVSGGAVFAPETHLLCDAAPLALIMEQMGGKATDGRGKRILDMAIADDQVHQTTTFCAGPAAIVDAIEKQLLAATSPMSSSSS